MSAFVCGNDHFKALAIFASRRIGGYGGGHIAVDPRYIKGLDPTGAYALRGIENLNSEELATVYANALYRENVRSVLARYSDDKESDYNEMILVSHHDERTMQRLGPVAILKMCDCLEYQSCETEDYRQTVAFDLLDSIRGAAIHALPGYDDAPWDYNVTRPKSAA